ncbi:hypothetical protein PCC82_06565 [Agrobacterium deltaense]
MADIGRGGQRKFSKKPIGINSEASPDKRRSSGADRLRKMHADPDFASARDERGRERFKQRREEMQRLSNAARRGYDVPPEREAEWKALKRKRTLSNDEIARMLGLKKWRKPRTRKGKPRNG